MNKELELELLSGLAKLVAEQTDRDGVVAFGHGGRNEVHLSVGKFVELFGSNYEVRRLGEFPSDTEWVQTYKGTTFFCLPY